VRRLLLVEDEPGLVLTLTDRLTREGYAVETAADGESGLERASSSPFDLIVLDVMLPRINGLDVLRELRRRGNETPVIVLTGSVTSSPAELSPAHNWTSSVHISAHRSRNLPRQSVKQPIQRAYHRRLTYYR
jgi:CheY-like chemotaxis protein